METVSKYEEIVNWIKSEMKKGSLRPGDKMESEHQLCDRFQVSRQTVRHAISILEKEGIVERRRGSGTYIRLSLKVEEKEKKTMLVAVMTTYTDEYIFSAIIKGIEQELSKAGYGMQVSFTNNTVEKERFILKRILEQGMVDGLIAEPTKSGLPNPNLDIYRKIMEKGIPVLFINSHYNGLEAPYVSLDDKLAGKMITNHLLLCGHRKIGAIFKADDGQGHQRYAGYIEALMESDIRINSKSVVWIDTDEVSNMWEDASRILRRLKGCTACVCYNDEIASAFVAICLEQRIKVPEHISVISIDDSNLANYCEVPLTSAKNPAYDLGKIAANHMVEMINGHSVPMATKLNPEIVNRNSVTIINSI